MLNFSEFEVLTFDCYGTLIDWESGILPVLQNLLKHHDVHLTDQLILELFAEFESQAESGPYISYREVLKKVVEGFSQKFSFTPTAKELYSLSESLKNWLPFPDTVGALKKLKERYKLAVISNIDRDLFTHTNQHLQVDFDWIITASQVQSYKPSLANFHMGTNTMGISPNKQLHIAQSIYHDIIPAQKLGIKTVWVNRRVGKLGGGATLSAIAQPDLEIPDLESLLTLM